MKILVTGNCGFIGQNFVRLYRGKHNLIGIDSHSYAYDKQAIELCPTMFGDISKKEDLESLIKYYGTFDAIINFAAESHVDNSIKSPEKFMNSNFIGVFNLLELAKNYGINKYVQVSTDEVFGDLTLKDPPFSNPHLLKPSSPYSASKAAADLLVLSYGRTYGMNVIITRACNNYGPYQFCEKFLPVVILNALNDKKIPIYGTGENQREWIFVNDHCKGIMAALEYGKSMSIYNLGSGFEMHNIDMVEKVLDILGKSHSLISFIEDRKGHDFRYFLNSSLAAKELNWRAETSFDKGLEKTIDWFVKNPKYWG